jgi:hypothetical protein
MPLITNVVLHCYAKINDRTNHPIRKLDITIRQTHYSCGNIIYVHQKFKYVLKVQIHVFCQVRILAPDWIWTMVEVPNKLSHSLVNKEIPPSMNVWCFHTRRHSPMKILLPNSFMIALHTCFGLVNAIVSLMEHTMSFFVEFAIPWESRFVILL